MKGNLAGQENWKQAYIWPASLTAIKFDKELKAYYERKVAEGKHKLSVLNAVKCKLLARVVSVVNNYKEYAQKIAEKSFVWIIEINGKKPS